MAASSHKATDENVESNDAQSDGVVLEPQPSDDPNDPLNWPATKKYATLAIWSLASFSSQASAMANLQGYVLQAPLYGKTPVQVSYSISAALAGLIAGALIVVPLGRKFGSCFCLLWSTVGVLVTAIWSALMTKPNDYNAFVVSRLFAGIFASPPLILGSATVLQIFFLHQRGKCLHILHIPYLLGVVVGPTFGGFIVATHPWPIQFWWTVGMNGLLILLIVLFLENTEYDRSGRQPTAASDPLFRRRVKTHLYGSAAIEPVSLSQFFRILGNEFLIGLSPISILGGLVLLIDFGFATMSYILSILFLELPVSEGGYGFNSNQAAAFTISQWIGLFIAEVYGHFVSDRIPLWLCRRNNNIWKQEYRLYCTAAPVIVLPIGLGLFASALQYHLHWAVLALGSVLIFAAGMSVVPIIMTYLCECFPDHAPETSAAMSVYRLGFGLSTNFFATPWISKVGVGWTFGMAALFTILASLILIFLIWKGPEARKVGLIKADVKEQPV
ncbi:Polyamine transporter [Tolypocladium capitatum]|uniref:Polyamine transporter n=1 Tax=Tolypocladium capitatum TaxID=45235 RepID=A0A2K3QHN0_9HYPO|nr:Polyamine transporter [Tolypocladium capitatum]